MRIKLTFNFYLRIRETFEFVISEAKKREQLNAGRGGGSAGLDDADLYDDYADEDDYDFM